MKISKVEAIAGFLGEQRRANTTRHGAAKIKAGCEALELNGHERYCVFRMLGYCAQDGTPAKYHGVGVTAGFAPGEVLWEMPVKLED